MASLPFLHIGRFPFIGLLLLIHSRLSDAVFQSSMLSCQGQCFINDRKELSCTRDPPPPSATPVDCISAPIRSGVRLTIGNFEIASKIAPGGLKFLNMNPGNQVHLILKIKFDSIDTESLRELQSLTNLTLYRSKKDTIHSCLFADRQLTGRLQVIEIYCMGMGMDLYHPFSFFVPVVPRPPVIQLRNCGVAPKCYRCQGDTSNVIWFKTVFGRLFRTRITKLRLCPEERQCSASALKKCPGLKPKTTTVKPTTTSPTTLPPTTTSTTTTTSQTTMLESSLPPTKLPPKATSSPAPQPSVPVGPVLGKSTKVKLSRNSPTKQYQFESDRPNLSQLVNDLSKRTDRTQRFLIVILIISIINSLVLIALLIYLFRRCRLCCRNDSPRGVYVITKNSPDHANFDNGKAGKTT